MVLQRLDLDLSVCKLRSLDGIDLNGELFFLGRTDRELSLVCPTRDAPEDAVAREDGWRAFRVEGTLDFSLVGILSRISGALAAAGVGLFAVSTYDTDYILVKAVDMQRAEDALSAEGMKWEDV